MITAQKLPRVTRGYTHKGIILKYIGTPTERMNDENVSFLYCTAVLLNRKTIQCRVQLSIERANGFDKDWSECPSVRRIGRSRP